MGALNYFSLLTPCRLMLPPNMCSVKCSVLNHLLHNTYGPYWTLHELCERCINTGHITVWGVGVETIQKLSFTLFARVPWNLSRTPTVRRPTPSSLRSSKGSLGRSISTALGCKKVRLTGFLAAAVIRHLKEKAPPSAWTPMWTQSKCARWLEARGAPR